MALKLLRRPCAVSIILVVLLTLRAFVTHSAARPLGYKTTVHKDERIMTSAEMQKRYVRPEGAVEAEIELGAGGGEGDRGGGIQWKRGGWNEGGGWDEGGNWDKGGGWNNRPLWAASTTQVKAASN